MNVKLLRVSVVAVAVFGVVAACDLTKTVNQLQARNVVVATILATPAVEIKAQAVAGLSRFDAGALLDAGVFFDGGLPNVGFTIPPQTVAFSFFGKLNGTTGVDQAPTGIAGAQVTLQQVGAGSWPLTEVSGAAGNYSLLGSDGGFNYVENATYDFNVVASGTTFTAEIVKAPAQEHITALHPAAGYIDQTANTVFTFIRPDPPAGQDRNLGFVLVFPVSESGKGEPTYTNVPQQPLDYLKLIVNPSEWKQTQVTIPATAFPEADHNYIIVLQSVKLGGPKTDNLFTGSAILGGTAEIGIVKTRP